MRISECHRFFMNRHALLFHHNFNLIGLSPLISSWTNVKQRPNWFSLSLFCHLNSFWWLDSIIFWRIKINISYQFWADNLSKNARSVALRPTVALSCQKSKQGKRGFFFEALLARREILAKKKRNRQPRCVYYIASKEKNSFKASVVVDT